ncbi:hypothetical protein Taro_010302, partial [Colocasia esculenta]|nr:hypothetical protein [Colocasia esculenta]
MAADPSATNLIDQQTLIPQRNSPQEPIEMGQVMQKLTAKNVDPKKQQEELKRLITAYLDKNYDRFADEMKKYSNVQENDPELQNLFYHFVYETVEGINAACGAMQYKLPNFEEFKKIFELEHKDKTKELTKQEFQKIILKL